MSREHRPGAPRAAPRPAGNRREAVADDLLPQFGAHVDGEGRRFEYARVRHDGAKTLVVHFSAFFVKPRAAKQLPERFGGYFHRLRMLGTSTEHHWLFLCDTFGARRNGTYYTGEAGDLFVERAMVSMVESELEDLGLSPSEMVTVGSSMGATGALVCGLSLEAAGIVAVSPHVDLRYSASMCGRFDEVAFACPDSDPGSESSRSVTQRVNMLLESFPRARALPRLFVQSAADDAGVYDEQVVPLVAQWHQRGGHVDLDLRESGGHTSHYATRALLLDACTRLLTAQPIDVTAYQSEPQFEPEAERVALVLRVRRRLRLGTKIRALRRAFRSLRRPQAAGRGAVPST